MDAHRRIFRTSGDFSVVTPDDVESERFNTVDVAHRKYTEALDCTETRVNYPTVEPGEEVTPHAHERQEELFVPLTGGQIAIEGDLYGVPQGGAVRVGPESIRNVVNRTADETHSWITIGASPAGTLDDFGSVSRPLPSRRGVSPARGRSGSPRA